MVAVAFTNSTEYQTNLIVSDYHSLLGRQPSSTEVAGWLQQFQAGMSGFQVEAAFLGSGEFFARQGNDVKTWLNAVYHDALNRAVDAGGLASWSQQLAAGLSRQSAAIGIVASPEALGLFVTAAYQDLLKRTPAPTEVAGWVKALQAGLTPSVFLAEVAASAEFIVLQGGLDFINPEPVPIVVPVGVDTFFDPFLFPTGIGVGIGFSGSGFSGGGFTGGGFTGGGFTGGGFSGGGSGGGSGS